MTCMTELRRVRRALGTTGSASSLRREPHPRKRHTAAREPVVDAPTAARELGITPQNAQRAIAPLVAVDILDEFNGFARNRLWQAREVLDALDDFAARAGRRG